LIELSEVGLSIFELNPVAVVGVLGFDKFLISDCDADPEVREDGTLTEMLAWALACAFGDGRAEVFAGATAGFFKGVALRPEPPVISSALRF
jgi:hypothetical protein